MKYVLYHSAECDKMKKTNKCSTDALEFLGVTTDIYVRG